MKFLLALLLVTFVYLAEAKSIARRSPNKRFYVLCVPEDKLKNCKDVLSEQKTVVKVVCVSADAGSDCLQELTNRSGGGDLVYVNDAYKTSKGSYGKPPRGSYGQPAHQGPRYKRQLDQETCESIALNGGQYGGALAGAAAGAAIGSFLPGIGTAIGSIVGLIFGQAGGTVVGAISGSQAC